MTAFVRPTVFVVEDNLLYQQMIARELESITDDVHFYTNGESCIEELYKNPSLLILDYNLEGPINGLDTLQHVRRKRPGVLALVFSSEKSLYSKENLRHYGTFDFLEKGEQSFHLLKQRIGRLLQLPVMG